MLKIKNPKHFSKIIKKAATFAANRFPYVRVELSYEKLIVSAINNSSCIRRYAEFENKGEENFVFILDAVQAKSFPEAEKIHYEKGSLYLLNRLGSSIGSLAGMKVLDPEKDIVRSVLSDLPIDRNPREEKNVITIGEKSLRICVNPKTLIKGLKGMDDQEVVELAIGLKCGPISILDVQEKDQTVVMPTFVR